MNRKILALSLALIMILTFTACSNSSDSISDSVDAGSSFNEDNSVPMFDRSGEEITLDGEVTSIISGSPAVTETLVNLGMADKIVAVDTYSAGIEGISAELPTFDMMTPDAEALIALNADVIIATGMSLAGSAEDPYKTVTDAGTFVTYIPSASSIDDIKKDIAFLGMLTNTEHKASEIIVNMESEIDAITSSVNGNGVKVYFEVASAPYATSLNDNTYIGEMLTLLGCENVVGEEEYQWVSITDEMVINSNPDVIFTTTDYIDAPTDEIKARAGWDVINAVKNDNVYYINTDYSNRPNENIVLALKEMADIIANVTK